MITCPCCGTELTDDVNSPLMARKSGATPAVIFALFETVFALAAVMILTKIPIHRRLPDA